MYSKQQASAIRQQFWTSFGKYMSPVPNSEGEPTNWINYKTGVKHIFFRMQAEKNYAVIAIELHHPDEEARTEVYEKFWSMKTLLEEALGESWDWQPHAIDASQKALASISKTLQPVNVFNQQDWPAIISFLKPRIVALDQFWNDVKPIFE